MKRPLIALFTLFVLVFPAWVHAAPLDDRVPGDALLYVGWAGADTLTPQYNQSNLKAIIDASAVKEFVSTKLPALIQMAAVDEPSAPRIIAQLQTGLGIVWRHPTAFYFRAMQFTDDQKPIFRFGVICDAGSDAPALVTLINESAVKNAPPELPINVVSEGNLVLVTFGKADTFADLKQGGPLSTAQAYLKTMAQVKQPAQALVVYGDVQKTLAFVKEALVKGGAPAEAQAKVPLALDALGLNSVTQIAMVGGFDNKGWTERYFIGISGPRHGLLTLFDTPPLSDAALAVVPRDAAAFSAGKLDLHKLYTETLAVIGKIDEGTAREFDQGIATANQTLDLNLEHDLFAALGDEWIIYRSSVPEGGLATVGVNKLRDGPALAKALAAFEKFFNEQGGGLRIERVATGKADVSLLSIPMVFNIAWTVKDGYFYVSSLSGIGGAIAQVETKAPSIATSDLYQKVMAGMPTGIKPTSISYSHPARLYPQLRTLVLGFLPLIRAQGIDIPMNILPDPTLVAEFMPPGGSVSWTDSDGIHGVDVSAFPGAALGQTNMSSGVAISALGVSMLLPSLGHSRELASRSADAANLRGIGQAAAIWAIDHNDQLPDHLGRLVAAHYVATKSLVSSRAGTMPLKMTPELEQLAASDFAKFAELLDQHCDFVYLGKGLKSGNDAAIILAYEKPGPRTFDGINIAFQDAHSEFIRWEGVTDFFVETNALLTKNGLPTVNVPALMKQVPGRGEAASQPAQLPGKP